MGAVPGTEGTEHGEDHSTPMFPLEAQGLLDAVRLISRYIPTAPLTQVYRNAAYHGVPRADKWEKGACMTRTISSRSGGMAVGSKIEDRITG